MYKLHKILQRFLCRIPIDSKQGAPGPPTRLCATMCVYLYPYPGAPTLPHAYLHTYMYTSLCMYVMMCVFILLSLSLLCSFSCCLCLSYSSLSSFFESDVTRPVLLACGKACPWAGAAGPYLSCVCERFILFNYYPIAYMYSMCVCIPVYCIVYVYTSCTVYVSNRCMYVHSIVCTVLCVCGLVYT